MILRIFDCLSRGEITWKFITFNRSYRMSESKKNSQNCVFCPRHYSEDHVRLRVPFPVFERKHFHKCVLVVRDSVVGIATRYGLDGPEIESQWGGGGEVSAPVQTGSGVHRTFYTMGTGSLSWG